MATSDRLGEKIAELRHKRRWTQTEFAQKLGVHMQNVTRWETNRFRPSDATLLKIAEVFEVTMDQLLDGKLLLPPALAQDQQLAERIEMLKELHVGERAIIYNIIETYATQKRLSKLLNIQKTSVAPVAEPHEDNSRPLHRRHYPTAGGRVLAGRQRPHHHH